MVLAALFAFERIRTVRIVFVLIRNGVRQIIVQFLIVGRVEREFAELLLGSLNDFGSVTFAIFALLSWLSTIVLAARRLVLVRFQCVEWQVVGRLPGLSLGRDLVDNVAVKIAKKIPGSKREKLVGRANNDSVHKMN